MKIKASYLWITLAILAPAIAQIKQSQDAGTSVHPRTKTQGSKHMSHIDAIDPYAKVDPNDLPPLVEMTVKQKEYLAIIFSSMREVMEQKRQLQEKDKVFGDGKFFWPKDPKKPIKTLISFDRENFSFRSIHIDFKRNRSDGRWSSAELSVHPRNFPIGVYQMDFSDAFFSGFSFQKSYAEKRENESFKLVNVFEYKAKDSNSGVSLRVEAAPEVSSVNERYPRSFHKITMYDPDK
jgi:hypothetical protein